jgi:plasmid stabilization system protein ParE
MANGKWTFTCKRFIAAWNFLRKNSEIGHRRDDIPEGYKTLNIEQHVLIFTVHGVSVIVARLLHHSRDMKRHL